MKYAIWAVVGIVLGFLLGGFGPRRESNQLRERITELENDLVEAQRNAPSRSTRFMPLPGMDALPARSTPVAVRTPPPATGETPLDTEGTSEASPTPFNDMAAFDAAVEAQRLRAAQSRQALREQADLGDNEMRDVDEIVDEMNELLAQYADELLAMVESGQDPEPLEFLGLSHEISGILYDSQAALEDVIGDSYGNVDDSAKQVWNYVDLGMFRDTLEQASNQ